MERERLGWKTIVVGLSVVAFAFVSDYFVDFPHWTYLNEWGIWQCPGDSNWFQFCGL